MAIARVAANLCLTALASGVSSVSRAFAVNITTGSVIVVAVIMTDNQTVSSVTDTQTNSYSQINTRQSAGTGNRCYLFYAKNATAGATTVTANLSGSGTATIIIAEYTGADTTAPLITQADNGSEGGGGNPASGAMDMAGSNGLAVGFALLYPMSTNPPGAGSGFTREHSAASTSGLYGNAYEDQLLSAASPNANWAETQSYWIALGAVFKEAGGAATVFNPLSGRGGAAAQPLAMH